MKTSSRILIAIAALALSSTYFLPLWQISLAAPQYPEGLGLCIWINKMTGENTGDLEKINNLNHYIGMKKIHPDSIKELKVMPWIMRGVLLLGLAVAIVKRKSLLLAWVVMFAMVAIAGLIDFYAWEYDYGHNLDTENAIIKIPGMNYQPPLIGNKQLLNFTASSWPAAGGLIAIASFLTGILILLVETKKWRRLFTRRHASTIIAATGLLLLLGCASSTTVPINYGQDNCDYCSMTIVDPHFGSELITTKHKAYKFDSIECLAAFCKKSPSVSENALLYVTDNDHPGKLISVEEAIIISSERFHSPMGAGLVAVTNEQSGNTLIDTYTGKKVSWNQVVQIVTAKWSL